MEANGQVNKPTENRIGFTILKWILIALGIFLVGWAVYCNVYTLELLAVSFLLSYLLDPVVTKMEKKGLSRTLSISLLLAILAISMMILMVILIPKISTQAKVLFSESPVVSRPDAVSPAADFSPPPGGEAVEKTNFVKWVDETVNPVLRDLGFQSLDHKELRARVQQLYRWVDSHYPQWSQSVLSVFQSMFTGVANFIVGILNLLLVPVFTFYLLRDYPMIRRSFYVNMPPHWREPVADWMGELDQVVGGFIRGQFSIALILAVINAVGLTLIGVPFGFLIGVIAGLANMVPYMSIVVGLIPAMLLAFLDQPDPWRLIWVLGLFGGAQLLEGFYLSPRIMGQEVGLHPVLIMLAIIVGGSLFGLTGIILAVPVAAVLKVITARCHEIWKKYWPVAA